MTSLQTFVCQFEPECHLLDHKFADVDEVAPFDEHGVPFWMEIVQKIEDEEDEDDDDDEVEDKEEEIKKKDKENKKKKFLCLATPWPHRIVRVVGDPLKIRSRREGAGEVPQLLGKGRG